MAKRSDWGYNQRKVGNWGSKVEYRTAPRGHATKGVHRRHDQLVSRGGRLQRSVEYDRQHYAQSSGGARKGMWRRQDGFDEHEGRTPLTSKVAGAFSAIGKFGKKHRSVLKRTPPVKVDKIEYDSCKSQGEYNSAKCVVEDDG